MDENPSAPFSIHLSMNRLWVLFSQTVAVALAVYFVVFTLKPEWTRGASSAARVEIAAARSGPVPPGSFRLAAARASPAVVSINTSKTAQANPLPANPLFQFFYGDKEQQDQTGLGSGVVVSEQGFVLTNHHVVKGADEIEVTLHGRRPVAAKVVGTDPDTDLAVLKIEADNLPRITWGSIESLQVGDQVLAIGNPFGVGQTVTVASSAPWDAISCASIPLRISSRPTQPSTPATRAARW